MQSALFFMQTEELRMEAQTGVTPSTCGFVRWLGKTRPKNAKIEKRCA